MNSPIHVTVFDSGDSAGSSLVETLRRHGCVVSTAKPNGTAIEAVRSADPHVVVLPVAKPPHETLELVKALKDDAATRDTPVVVLGGEPGDGFQSQALDAGVDGLLHRDFRDIELYTRVRALARLKVMQTELARRVAIEQRFGLSREMLSPAPTEIDGVQILAAGDLSRDTKALTAALGERSYVSFAEDPQQAIDKLTSGSFDAAVVGIDGMPDEWLTMCADVRDNPRLFNLPVLLIAEPSCFSDPDLPFEKGVTDLLLHPVDKDEFGARLQILIRQRRYRRHMQDAYRRSLHLETGDSLTGLYSFGYLHDYLGSLIADAAAGDKELTVAVLDVEGMAEINRAHGYAGGDRVLRQIGGLISRLVRGEDLSARYGGAEFCVVMPETPADVGATALRRVANIVRQTDLGVQTAEEAINVSLKMGWTTVEPGDTPESLLARAREATTR